MKLVFSILLFLSVKIVDAQLYGIQWVLGYSVSVLDFRNDTLTNYAIHPLMPYTLTSANICDSSGNLLYYTNGIYISGANGNQLHNGGGLSPCDYTNQYACCGLNIPQAALFLPKPGDASRYYLIHFSNDTFDNNLPGTLYYTEIRDSGIGVVESKNIPFGKGIFRQGGMTACKHANGRDWWIVIGDKVNTYYSFLLTPNGIATPLTQTIGPSFDNPFDIAYSKFSQDGSKYVTSCNEGYVLVMDFDRCTGLFSNPIDIFNNVSDPPSSGGYPEFSPNGRFIYVSNTINLNQFDLWASNPQLDSSMVDAADSSDPAQIDFPQIAPNGKLYISCFAGGYYIIHVINFPDLKGDSCMYVDTAFKTLTANSVSFPNMINYQLGSLVGSGCDTIPNGIATVTTNNLLRVMPNPADKYLYVEMGMQGNYEFDLMNAFGHVVGRKETRQVDIFDTENLASGVYFIRVMDKNSLNKISTQKVVVQHR